MLGEIPRRLTEPLDDDALRVGERIRARRRALGLTLKQVAAAADLSHGFVSLVERGRTRPSMPSFTRLTRALQTTPVDMLLGVAEPPLSAAGSSTYAQVGGRVIHDEPGRIRVVEVTTDADESDGFQQHDEYSELLVVLDGELEVSLVDRVVRVPAGQSIHYQAGVKHNWRAVGDRAVRMLLMHISETAPGGEAVPSRL